MVVQKPEISQRCQAVSGGVGVSRVKFKDEGGAGEPASANRGRALDLQTKCFPWLREISLRYPGVFVPVLFVKKKKKKEVPELDFTLELFRIVFQFPKKLNGVCRAASVCTAHSREGPPAVAASCTASPAPSAAVVEW